LDDKIKANELRHMAQRGEKRNRPTYSMFVGKMKEDYLEGLSIEGRKTLNWTLKK
jgi:hypothetical protein